MSATATVYLPEEPFVDRRSASHRTKCPAANAASSPTATTSSRPKPPSSPRAIDGYKLQHRRRFITFEEMLAVIKSLGYEPQLIGSRSQPMRLTRL